MKIAVVTDDGKTISQHFGRAPYYLVLTIEDGKITASEMRDRSAQNQLHDEHSRGLRTLDPASDNKHAQLAASISDCEMLLCGGMGMNAYSSLRKLYIEPVITNLRDIQEAVQEYIEGKLINRTEKLH